MTLTEIIEQLRSCNYECEAGKLENNTAWVELERMAGDIDEMAKQEAELWWRYVDDEPMFTKVELNEERLLQLAGLIRTT